MQHENKQSEEMPVEWTLLVAQSGNKFAALDGGNESPGGESVVGQGDVSRPGTPAQRLAVSGSARAKAEKCLAEAAYFEARGEPLRGQDAVAQVVMNRLRKCKKPRKNR
jgi:spore germination cell wall hydrolase CwlJ-like protein